MSIPFTPSDDQSRTVKALAEIGVPQDAIAGYIDIDPKTLRKAFRMALGHGNLEGANNVNQVLSVESDAGCDFPTRIVWLSVSTKCLR